VLLSKVAIQVRDADVRIVSEFRPEMLDNDRGYHRLARAWDTWAE
jgi:hypothetical protein